MNKEVYQRAEMEIVTFATQDVIATSQNIPTDPYEDVIPHQPQ